MSINDQELTDWFDGKTTVPGQFGVYARKSPIFNPHGYSYWNGEHWGATSADAERAFQLRYLKSNCQDRPWRGFLTEHKPVKNYIPMNRYQVAS